MTVYRENSELSQINRDAAWVSVEIGEELAEVIELSLQVSRQTEGAFDITSGVLSRCWGFKERNGRVPSDEAIRECLSRIGWQHVRLDRGERRLYFEREGLELNLGSVGKGFALDHAATMLQNADFGKVLLHAGHSSMIAFGDSFCPGGGWLVSIRHPVESDRELVHLRLRNQALGTSGIGEQFFESEDKSYGHVIDPRTGRPAERNLSASCLAPTAALADALATAFFVMPLEKIEACCDEHEGIGAIVVPRPNQCGSVDPVYFGIASTCVAG
jgi:thiamine biosynthesis lipoprotein